MGAGAGYTVFVKNAGLGLSINDIANGISNYSLDIHDRGCTVSIDCDIILTGDIKAESYYYGCDFIDGVLLRMQKITADLGLGNGYNADILTDEARYRYEGMYNLDIEALYMEIVNDITVDDIRSEYIAELVAENLPISGDGLVGGGWSHHPFDGEFTINPEYNFYSVTFSVVDSYITEFIDQAVTGDNVAYAVCLNGESIADVDSEQEAIDLLKSNLSVPFDEETDLYDSYVIKDYYTISADNYIDWLGQDEIVYRASDDPDYQEYL